METQVGDGGDEQDQETREDLLRKLKYMKANLKQARKDKGEAERDLRDAKRRKGNGKGKGITPSSTFDRSNPTQMLTSKAYSKLSQADRDLIHEARKRAGIPTRQIGSFTVRFEEPADGEPVPMVATGEATPTAGVSPALLKPSLKKVSLTQRAATYKKGSQE